ncbi:MAG: hypothetical protein K6F27_01575 [Ruminococcus sp.]|nr:hypothetical protein [Ruminococcus sp.]
MDNDMFEQEDELKKDKETAKTGCLIGVLILLCIAFVFCLSIRFLLDMGDGKEETFKSSFTTELGDDFEVYFVEETTFLKVDDFYELRQKGDDQYIIQTTRPVTNDDLTVIEDSDSLRAYRVCGTIIYSQEGDDFKDLRHLTDADGRFVGYVRKNLLSSYGFMSNYFHDYVALYPEERDLIINAIEKKIKGVLERYGYNYDAKELEKMRKELWRYKPIDDSYAAK